MTAKSRALAAIILVVYPDLAWAHAPIAGVGGVYGGFLHAWLVPLHTMAVIALGILIAGETRKVTCIIVFVLGLVAGNLILAKAYAPAYAGDAVTLLALIAGALVALGRPAPIILLASAALATGLALALDSPPEALTINEAIAIQIATVCGATLLMIAVVAAVSRLQRQWQRIGLRIAGSWIAASAILVLALRLVR